MNPGLLDLLAQSAEAQRADPTQRPACPDERPHDCAAIDAEPRPLPLAQQPTVRPPKCACGRPEIAGHACAGCDAPQWVMRPTKEGIWWVWDGKGVDLMHIGRFEVNGEECWSHLRVIDGGPKQGRELPSWWRFLDARLTPPAPPGDR